MLVRSAPQLDQLPTEVLEQIFGFLDDDVVPDLNRRILDRKYMPVSLMAMASLNDRFSSIIENLWIQKADKDHDYHVVVDFLYDMNEPDYILQGICMWLRCIHKSVRFLEFVGDISIKFLHYFPNDIIFNNCCIVYQYYCKNHLPWSWLYTYFPCSFFGFNCMLTAVDDDDDI
ncbi:cryptochrome-2, F-box/LRR-repeat protein 3, S-phase Clock, Ubiquitination, LRR, F-box.7A [Drosophila suzukii associated hytrosavirus 1]|nr:cryptochrome-2, F-box/LRR-repeat protein 3, S-phase Clock, Ubiquitination, LRR, F-box.7A [Drosophila suzukii associated hytrosavirus 1]